MVVSTSAIDCLERLVSEMTYCVSSGTLNPTHSLQSAACVFALHAQLFTVSSPSNIPSVSLCGLLHTRLYYTLYSVCLSVSAVGFSSVPETSNLVHRIAVTYSRAFLDQIVENCSGVAIG